MAAPNPTDPVGAPVASLTYRHLFLDVANDPYVGNYAGIMSRFTTTLQPITAARSAQLRTRIFATTERELQAYLIGTHVDGRDPVIQVLHRPSVRHTPLDSAADDEEYGFIDDARHGQPPMLALWPERATGQTNSVNVLSDTGTDTALSASKPPPRRRVRPVYCRIPTERSRDGKPLCYPHVPNTNHTLGAAANVRVVQPAAVDPRTHSRPGPVRTL
jgi:hypothetical protein